MIEPDNLELDSLLERQAFEAWARNHRYYWNLDIWGEDVPEYHGEYSDLAVQLAWEAWCEAKKLRTTHDQAI